MHYDYDIHPAFSLLEALLWLLLSGSKQELGELWWFICFQMSKFLS